VRGRGGVGLTGLGGPCAHAGMVGPGEEDARRVGREKKNC
jgi:hypothetical protein